ncbi:hypothetical protein [Actinophytocola xanthii]|uniref:Uncharacterized protein n=1 Tax=Actinophytocola xanthii TaxID=1912961 RepID=A0A1Q8C8W3_9PSEU|nr:hypothetical protein [Actinophytocola xanthii]OLF10773.1 hypothetical protein BU204_31225 [Actinophytocola xanthii]
MLTALVVLLVVIGVLALASVPLMIRSTRRQLVADVPPGARHPAVGSPAQVWTERGERVLRELAALLADHADPDGAVVGISEDAARVVAELRITASRVAELDHALAAIPVPALERRLPELGADAPSGTRDAVAARLEVARRHRAAREALLATMRDTVGELERARDELAEVVGELAHPVAAGGEPGDNATARLTGRLDALREGLVEVRDVAHPEVGPGTQGYP